MSRLSDLLRQVERVDEQLAADVRAEVKALERRRPFGLNFERHVPETVELPGREVRRGDKVRVVGGSDDPYVVQRVVDGRAALIGSDGQRPEHGVDELVVIAEFRDRIHPGLRFDGEVKRGGDKPCHTVINAENFHALQALTFTHEGKVDAIYIDPPYNTGARDWKYNNDYVDADDGYRHSKWLAMMERRLRMAQRLLNPENSVLIVTIDEKEYLRLGQLLEQTFPDAKIQMISSVVAPGGTIRVSEFTRVNEFIFFVMLGGATPVKTANDMLFTDVRPVAANRSAIWNSLRRRGAGNLRSDSPSKFYPVYVRSGDGKVLGCGQPLADGDSSVSTESGVDAVLPILPDGREGRWELNTTSFSDRLSRGYVRTSTRNNGREYIVQYLRNAEMERVENGELTSKGLAPQGHHLLDYSNTVLRTMYAKTVWNRTSHDAGTFGSRLVKSFVGGRKFPFPKSLYAVEDTLRFFVADKPEAVVLDFFAGSGTTTHAVMRLNKQDGGRRQCISVTNNEVAADEQQQLRAQGLRPGDAEWEKWGICDHVTKPRIEAAITGETPEGEPIKGDYKFTDEFPMADGFEENAEFFTLTYEAQRAVLHGKAFDALAPLLWLRAGAQGRRIDRANDSFDVADAYGVLFNVDHASGFLHALTEQTRIAYVVTDDERAFQVICADLPEHVEPVRLYESYLTTFTAGGGIE